MASAVHSGRRESRESADGNAPDGDVHDIVREGGHGVLLEDRDLVCISFMRVQEKLLLDQSPNLLRVDRFVLEPRARERDVSDASLQALAGQKGREHRG